MTCISIRYETDLFERLWRYVHNNHDKTYEGVCVLFSSCFLIFIYLWCIYVHNARYPLTLSPALWSQWCDVRVGGWVGEAFSHRNTAPWNPYKTINTTGVRGGWEVGVPKQHSWRWHDRMTTYWHPNHVKTQPRHACVYVRMHVCMYAGP